MDEKRRFALYLESEIIEIIKIRCAKLNWSYSKYITELVLGRMVGDDKEGDRE